MVHAKRLILGLTLFGCGGSTSVLCSQEAQQWTWMFKTFFNPNQRKKNGKKKEIGFVATDTPKFTQCIFSWNAKRPSHGYYSFYAQVRDAKTQQWHVWHKMFDWGADVQRSHLTTSKIGTSYHYVRLEVPTALPADGVRIRIEPHDGAYLGSVYGLYASASRLDKFKPEKPTQFAQLPSVRIKGIPLYSQKVLEHARKDSLCSPTSLSMVTSYLTQNTLDPCIFADKVYDAGLDAYGSWPFNTAHAFDVVGSSHSFYVRRLPSFTTLYHSLRKKIPVVVSVRGALTGAAKEYNQGHLLVVTGWDKKTKSVFCHDPAFEQNEQVAVAYPLKDFLKAWERSRRLAYIAEPVR